MRSHNKGERTYTLFGVDSTILPQSSEMCKGKRYEGVESRRGFPLYLPRCAEQ